MANTIGKPWRRRGRDQKTNLPLQELYEYNGQLLNKDSLEEELDKLTHAEQVEKLEEYRELVSGTQGVTDYIDTP